MRKKFKICLGVFTLILIGLIFIRSNSGKKISGNINFSDTTTSPITISLDTSKLKNSINGNFEGNLKKGAIKIEVSSDNTILYETEISKTGKYSDEFNFKNKYKNISLTIFPNNSTGSFSYTIK